MHPFDRVRLQLTGSKEGNRESNSKEKVTSLEPCDSFHESHVSPVSSNCGSKAEGGGPRGALGWKTNREGGGGVMRPAFNAL